MSATAIELVRPAGARYEGLALAAATLAVAGALALYVRAHGSEGFTEPLHDWQVSAFETLTGADQAVYNALYTVKDEIPLIYDDINLFNPPGVKFRWPNLDDFQEWLLPPFYKDTSWRQNGSLAWSLFEPLAEGEMQGSTMYLGTDGTLPGQGSFLLIIGHVHAGITNNNAIVIWWHEQNHVEMPQSGFRDGLILQGWREVVPYSGAQEVRRIFGDDAPAAFPELPEGIGTAPAVPESESEDVESIIEGALEN
ncbi:MAG TPA: hypothetical protein VKA43_10300 [Gammaproteobacteria bacterium]|nr:hypothetical protein [Gammaproteobacteria bacterium]